MIMNLEETIHVISNLSIVSLHVEIQSWPFIINLKWIIIVTLFVQYR